jgi:Fe-S cluster biogenesis protein NfuA
MTRADEDRIRRIDELVRRIDGIADPSVRELTGELMQSILALHGSGIERMMELIAESGAPGDMLFRHFANDPLVSSLLVLHGLHPDDIETRVRHVLSKHPSQGELLGVFEGVVRVRIAAGGCQSDGTTVQSLEAMLRDAIPDATEIIVVEGLPAQGGFVPLTALDPFFSSPVLLKG